MSLPYVLKQRDLMYSKLCWRMNRSRTSINLCWLSLPLPLQTWTRRGGGAWFKQSKWSDFYFPLNFDQLWCLWWWPWCRHLSNKIINFYLDFYTRCTHRWNSPFRSNGFYDYNCLIYCDCWKFSWTAFTRSHPSWPWPKQFQRTLQKTERGLQKEEED